MAMAEINLFTLMFLGIHASLLCGANDKLTSLNAAGKLTMFKDVLNLAYADFQASPILLECLSTPAVDILEMINEDPRR